jgi:hypothetical protein
LTKLFRAYSEGALPAHSVEKQAFAIAEMAVSNLARAPF